MQLREKEKLELQNAFYLYYHTKMPLPDHVAKKGYIGLNRDEIINKFPECKEIKFNAKYKSLEHDDGYRTLLFEMDENNKCTAAFQFVGIVYQNEEEA